MNEFKSDIDIRFFYPASYAESVAFVPRYQSKDKLLKELIARVVAIVAPILFAVQAGLRFFFALFERIDPPSFNKKLYKKTFQEGVLFTKSMISAVLEIPEKLIHGPNRCVNYLNISDRYEFETVLTKRLITVMPFGTYLRDFVDFLENV